ncbi:MAG: histidinol-phosphatase HisJ family protein [Clostridia bacterium]|nr:histidinol-phosphatase HisJ family protein [Clostridia bacterium]
MRLFNSHTHTEHSADCTVPASDMCQSAVAAGLSGIAFCDHCHGRDYITYNTYDVLKYSHHDAHQLAKEYEGRLEVFAGAEFDEMLWSPEYINRLIDTFDFDVILASVHRVRNVPDTNYISRVNFASFKPDTLHHFISRYFEDILETAEKCDFDVLSHLTLILRYVSGKHKIKVDLSEFNDIIDEILKVIIKRGKALELNTSEVGNIGLMPDINILRRYRAFGGDLVTIGTDAHLPKNIAHGFSDAVDALRECGFSHYVYYKNRQVKYEPI